MTTEQKAKIVEEMVAWLEERNPQPVNVMTLYEQ